MNNIFYFGLEPLKSRYTHQLSNIWMPDTFKDSTLNFVSIDGIKEHTTIKKGVVLDATQRSKFSMYQIINFLTLIERGEVKNGDVLFFQDFWTPGVESIFYALELYDIKVRVYSMLHAQSVDEYDFTYTMKSWMRYYELGMDEYSSGIFVGSTIHKEQLRQAGFESPIHVVSLPFHSECVRTNYPVKYEKENQIIFTSRLDKEKNPYFMLKCAEVILAKYPNFKFVVTTSGETFRSSVDGFLSDMYKFAKNNPRFILKSNLSKDEYYKELKKSKIQLNTSLQDYVSWTVIESTFFGCDICFPNFRSFPEFISTNRLYHPFKVNSVLDVINNCINAPQTHNYISEYSNAGRLLEKYIIENDITTELNVWLEYDYIKKLLNNE